MRPDESTAIAVQSAKLTVLGATACRAMAALRSSQQQTTGAPPHLGLPSTTTALTPRLFANADNLVSFLPIPWPTLVLSVQATLLGEC